MLVLSRAGQPRAVDPVPSGGSLTRRVACATWSRPEAEGGDVESSRSAGIDPSGSWKFSIDSEEEWQKNMRADSWGGGWRGGRVVGGGGGGDNIRVGGEGKSANASSRAANTWPVCTGTRSEPCALDWLIGLGVGRVAGRARDGAGVLQCSTSPFHLHRFPTLSCLSFNINRIFHCLFLSGKSHRVEE